MSQPLYRHDDTKLDEEVQNIYQVFSSLPIGTVIEFAVASNDVPDIPDDWLECNGEYYSKQEYGELYKQIGSSANLSTGIFAVPNLSGSSGTIKIIKAR